LEPIALDPEGAADLLKRAGWIDSDNDGILDKIIDGRKHDMVLDIFTSPSQLSQDVAIILKAEADKAGIKMNIKPDDLKNIVQQARNAQFDLACLASVQSIGPYDPYNSWHSDNIGGGNNLPRFRNQEVDLIIESIRSTLDTEERNILYKRFQKIIHHEQPTLFLVAPKTPIASSSRLSFSATSLRPGYFENTFTLK
jgi:peptide/nickel transport system substrate-binding protein